MTLLQSITNLMYNVGYDFINFDNGLGNLQDQQFSVLEVDKVPKLITTIIYKKGRDGDKLLFNSMYSLQPLPLPLIVGKRTKATKNNNKTMQKTNYIIIIITMKINELRKKKTQKQK